MKEITFQLNGVRYFKVISNEQFECGIIDIPPALPPTPTFSHENANPPKNCEPIKFNRFEKTNLTLHDRYYIYKEVK